MCIRIPLLRRALCRVLVAVVPLLSRAARWLSSSCAQKSSLPDGVISRRACVVLEYVYWRVVSERGTVSLRGLNRRVDGYGGRDNNLRIDRGN